jgi:hypothetical protein
MAYEKAASEKFVIRQIAGKADRVADATNGHLAALDSDGNLTDSGKSASDFADASHAHTPSQITGLMDGEKINSSLLPSYVDDVQEYDGTSSFPTTGELGKIYVDTSTNKTYRWSGKTYIEIAASPVTSVNGQTGAVTVLVPEISTNISTDAASDAKTASPKAVKTFVESKGYLTSHQDISGKASLTDLPYALVTKTPANGSAALSDRAVNAVSVSEATTLTLPALENSGKARDFLVRLAISGSTVPTVTFAAPTGETIVYETDGDEFPVPDAEGTWLYSFTETAAGVFAVALKSVNVVTQGGS